MPRILRRIADAMRRWVSESDERDDPHVGQKAADEPGFGGATGAERRRRRVRRRRPPNPRRPGQTDR